MAAAKEQTPEAQIAALHAIAQRGRVSPKPVKDQIAAIEAAIADTIKWAPALDAAVEAVFAPKAGEVEERPSIGNKPLRTLAGVTAGELARWIRATTPDNIDDTIRVLETTATILRSGGP